MTRPINVAVHYINAISNVTFTCCLDAYENVC